MRTNHILRDLFLVGGLLLGAGSFASAQEQQVRQIKQQQANESIAQDDFVREAQAEFGANLVAESIKPIGG